MSDEAAVPDQELVQAANAARVRAYAPYSDFRVGAAILDGRGEVHVGVNVENASLGLTICAERAAVCRMVADGGRRVERIAVATGADRPIAPCGACRQVLAEHGPEATVILCTIDGRESRRTLAELLPDRFGPEDLG